MALERARDIYVEEIMSKVPVVGGPDLTAKDLAVLMRAMKVGSVIIIRDGCPMGIVTERDLVEKVVAEDRQAREVKAENIMSMPLVTVTPRESVADAGRKMARLQLRRLPVVKDGRLVGMLTENDITQLSPSLIEITREWKSINIPVADVREPESFAGYCENCENFSYDLKQTGTASGRGSLLCAECRDIFGREPTE